MRKYIKDTEAFKGEITRLFITTTTLYRKASKDKKQLSTLIFRPYPTRSASTSMVRTINFPLYTVSVRYEDVLEAFDKPIRTFEFANAILQVKT